MLYQGFLLRDIFGYVFPGFLVLGFMLFLFEDNINSLLQKEMFQSLLTLPHFKTVSMLFSIILAYLLGISIFAVGIFTGLLRYYPYRMSRLTFHLESVQFTSNPLIKKFSDSRERLVILLHSSGNIAISFIFCFFIFFGNTYSYFILGFGIAALLRHWETVYNLRSFQEAILVTHNIEISDAHKKEDLLGKFFEVGGLLGSLLILIGLLYHFLKGIKSTVEH